MRKPTITDQRGPLYLLEGAESQEQTRLPPHCRTKPFITLLILYEGRAKKGGGYGLRPEGPACKGVREKVPDLRGVGTKSLGKNRYSENSTK